MKAQFPLAEGRPQRLFLPAGPVRFILLCICFLMTTGNAVAMEIEEWRFSTSLVTWHWSPSDEHNNQTHLLDLEFETTKRWIYGFAWFDNSFGQTSQYLYAGYSWDLFGTDWAYFKLTGGLLHGYKEPYEDKIPFNGLGVAPAAIPTFGFKYKRVFSEIQILGGAAVTITGGFTFGLRKEDD